MKYIIEIEEKPLCVFDKDTQTYFPRLWRVKGFNSLVFDEEGLSRLEELNSDYISKHFSDLQDDAYERGHEIGYQKGFEDGKAVSDKGCEGCMYQDRGSVGIPCIYCSNNFKNQWTAKQTDDRIEVGDEVETKDGKRFVVTTLGSSLDGDIAVGVCADGFGLGVDLKELCKTGKHFDIASILKEMQS